MTMTALYFTNHIYKLDMMSKNPTTIKVGDFSNQC